MTTTTPVGTSTPTPTPSMGGLLRSELTKTFTTRLWWALLIPAVLLTGLQAAATAATASLGGSGGDGTVGPSLSDSEALARLVYAGAAFQGTYLFALVVGVIAMTAEYRHQTATPTFLATPRRARVVVAKAGAQLGVGLVYGGAAVLVAVLAGSLVLGLTDEPIGLGSAGLGRALVLVLVALGLWTLVGLGLGTLIRNQVAAVVVAVALGLVIEPIIGLLLNLADLGEVARFLPSAASAAVTSPGGDVANLLPWWGGALVMLAYGVVFAGIGVLLSVRRDIT